MTYRLYNRTGSGGFVVEAALALADAPFELAVIESKPGTPLPDSFRDTNPWRQVPTLILPDGSIMTETSAILIHLAACFPDKKLAPTPGSIGHAAFLRWTIFANVNIYEAVLRRVYPNRYTTDPNATQATIDAANQRMGEALIVLENAITTGPFLLGETMCLADVYITMLYVWFKGGIDAPRLSALRDKVKQDTIIAPLWRRHFGDRG
ncbi:MAG: glutathione S-transferase family protein [Alphaproteobacteria bacterium]|nr:glutathione S-transferase family protein [Alphaproteobacteria bacterium]